MQNKRIFTFWEPADKLPEYLQLCMMTWKKFLPEYEIVILDYKNLDNWLGKNYFDKTLYEKFSLPKQADAIRCAILKKYGGIWFDVDTIVTSEDINQLFDIVPPPELTLVGKRIPVIFAKQNARILVKWENGIKKHIEIVKQNTNNIFNKIKLLFFNYKLFKKIRKWDYLGDAILKSLLANQPKEILYSINFKKNKIYPDFQSNLQKQINTVMSYIKGGRLLTYEDYPQQIKKTMLYATHQRIRINIKKYLKYQAQKAKQNLEKEKQNLTLRTQKLKETKLEITQAEFLLKQLEEKIQRLKQKKQRDFNKIQTSSNKLL